MGLFSTKRTAPAAPTPVARGPEPTPEVVEAKLPSPRSLIVHGAECALPELRRQLRALPGRWTLSFKSCATQVLELAAQSPPDGVFCDMPVNGAECVELLQSIARQCPAAVLFLRGDPSRCQQAQRVRGVAVQFLPVTLDAEAFNEAVLRAFRMQQWLAGAGVGELLGQMKRLPSVPTLYTQVLGELAKPESSLMFVGRLIAREPAMTAKILQCVNSAAFGLCREITDPAEAVMQLGVERTKALILAASVFQELTQAGCAGFSHEKLWQHSMAVGGYARMVSNSQDKDSRRADQAFTAGLLHDVGKLLLAANLPEMYADIIAQAVKREVDVGLVEREALGTTHAELGACFLAGWGLPLALLEAVAWHHEPGESGESDFTVLSAVHVANAIDNEAHAPVADAMVSLMDADYVKEIGLGGSQNRWREVCGRPAKPVDGIEARQEARMN